MVRLAVARLWFCSNSFVPVRTTLADLQCAEWSDGPDALRRAAPGSDLDGVSRFLAVRPLWNATVLRASSAPAGGPLTATALLAWLEDVETGLRRGRFDALFLALHGACQAEGDPRADLTILSRLRGIMGRRPIVASFDMHANVAEETVLLLDGASANRVWPHGGADGAALRALKLLEGVLEHRIRPIGVIARAPIADGSSGDADAAPARASSPHGGSGGARSAAPGAILEASVFWGFAWGDAANRHACAMVWADCDAAIARAQARRIAARLGRWWPRYGSDPIPLDAAIAEAAGSEAAALLDIADDPLVGGLAETPELLSAVLAAPPPRGAVVGIITDGEAVAAAIAAGVGGRVSIGVGARRTRLFGAPVPVEADVRRIVRGIPQAPGEAGTTLVVLRSGGVDIVLNDRRTGGLEPATLLRAGIDLGAGRLLALKAGEAARAAFSPYVSRFVVCDCAGPAAPGATKRPFAFARPMLRQRRTDPSAATPVQPAAPGDGRLSAAATLLPV